MFFSADSARMDIVLTSQKHKEDQVKFRADNELHQIYKEMPIEQVTGSIGEMKETAEFFEDAYLQWYIEKKAE